MEGKNGSEEGLRFEGAFYWIGCFVKRYLFCLQSQPTGKPRRPFANYVLVVLQVCSPITTMPLGTDLIFLMQDMVINIYCIHVHINFYIYEHGSNDTSSWSSSPTPVFILFSHTFPFYSEFGTMRLSSFLVVYLWHKVCAYMCFWMLS